MSSVIGTRASTATRMCAPQKVVDRQSATIRSGHIKFVAGDRLLADLGNDRSSSRMAGVRLVSGISLNHHNMDDIAGNRRPRLSDVAGHDHPHQRWYCWWRGSAVAGVRRPCLATGWGRVAVLEALEARWRRAATHRIGLPPLRTPPEHGGPGMVLEIADYEGSTRCKREGPLHSDCVRGDRTRGVRHKRLQRVRSRLNTRVRERGLAVTVSDSCTCQARVRPRNDLELYSYIRESLATRVLERGCDSRGLAH